MKRRSFLRGLLAAVPAIGAAKVLAKEDSVAREEYIPQTDTAYEWRQMSQSFEVKEPIFDPLARHVGKAE